VRIPDIYTLPNIDFVAGSTQDFVFHCYFYSGRRPHDLSTCTADFAIIDFVNKYGEPLKHKSMEVGSDWAVDGDIKNVLRVTLEPADTVDLPRGKYIYQITIKDINGDVDIPKQGIIHIVNNIHKAFVKQPI